MFRCGWIAAASLLSCPSADEVLDEAVVDAELGERTVAEQVDARVDRR